VCLVEDQDVEPVALGRHELVEVLEHLLHARRPSPGDLAQRLGERARTGGVQHRAALSRKLAQQRQRHYGLPAARPSAYDDHPLGVGAARLLHRVKHQVDRELLIAEQPELLAVADLVGGHLEQLLGRCDGRTQQRVARGVPTRVRRQSGPQKVEQVAAVRAGEQPARGGDRVAAQVRDRRRVGGVVQVGQAGEGIGLVGQRAGEVREVGAVALHLGHRVQLRAAGHARYVDQLRASLIRPGRRPLLQLNDHIGRLPGVRMGSREHDVGALRG